MSDSIGPLITIDGGNNPDSGWLDIGWLTQDISFSIYGTFVGTVLLDVSNDPTPTNKTFYSAAVASYTTVTQAPLGLPRNMGSFIRFRRSGWVSGTAMIGLSNGIDASNHSKPVSVESAKFGQ